MPEETLKQRLTDPAYLDRHLLAAAILQRHQKVPWYDSHFLRYFSAAKAYLKEAEPDALEHFLAGFEPLQKAPNDAPIKRDGLFDHETQQRMKTIITNLPSAALERHEEEDFGRQVVHDHPEFVALQAAILHMVSAMAGQELVCGYNFLSLYGGEGVCAPHMDEPISMYTLDYCIDQNTKWPIYFSQRVNWPETDEMQSLNPESIRHDPDLRFVCEEIKPGEALLFNGSSHWHYRDAIPSGGYSHLLFFHYHPAGTQKLVRPPLWHEHFDLPVLEPLCDLFDDNYPPLPSAKATNS